LSIDFKILSARNIVFPSFPLAEERVVERSDDRVSQPAMHDRQCKHHASTHPDYASLIDPLFAFGAKRVAAISLYFKH